MAADGCRSGIPPRTLQDVLATHSWDHERTVDRLQDFVAEHHHDEQAIGLIDETSFAKRGDKTTGVQRQYCGSRGKIDNCVVSVALGYAGLRGEILTAISHLFLARTRLRLVGEGAVEGEKN